MAKVRVADFDQDACYGRRAGVDGECPHLEDVDADTGRRIIDGLASVEGRALEAATGDEQHKCGLCSCPLANLAATDVAPESCPRLDKHS